MAWQNFNPDKKDYELLGVGNAILAKAYRALACLFKQIREKFLGRLNDPSADFRYVSSSPGFKLTKVRVTSGPVWLEAYVHEPQPPPFLRYKRRGPKYRIMNIKPPDKPSGDVGNFSNLYPKAKVLTALFERLSNFYLTEQVPKK